MFKDVEEARYNAVVQDSNYYPNAQNFVIKKNQNSSIIMSLIRQREKHDLIILLKNFTPNKLFDLKLYAKNLRGYECEVSPTNKFCAYSHHVEDK